MQRTLKLWRTFREGLINFRRNGWLSFATMSILSLALFVMAFGFLISLATTSILKNWENNISVIVSFEPDVPEDRIYSIKDTISRYQEIASIEYISRERALETLIASKGDLIRDAVEVIGENPLLPSLSIRARNQADYETIVRALENSQYREDIHNINYQQNQDVYNRLRTISDTARKLSLSFGGMFAFIALLITFNTIRITIYSHRQEFEIMRLVGASNLYVRMPYIFEGILYGLTAAFVALVALGIVARLLSGLTNGMLFAVLLDNLVLFIVSIVTASIVLGVLSSFIAIRRYLKT